MSFYGIIADSKLGEGVVMIRIIVIEDDKETQTHIKKIIRETEFLKDEEIQVDYFTKYTNDLKEIIMDNSEHKIYIVDIELETKVSGIDIAKFVRENDWESEIIFITNHDKMFETVYRSVYEVFDFIEKFHEMDLKLKKDLKVIYKRNFDNKMFRYRNNNFSIQIYYRSITHIYRDKETRKIIINTDKTHYAIIMPLTDILNSLDDRFRITHRACIVNNDRVESYNWSRGFFILDNGKKVEMLSKKYKKEIEDYNESIK